MDIAEKQDTVGKQPVKDKGEGKNGAANKRVPLIKVIMADVLIAAMLLNVFALYYFLLPRAQDGHAAVVTELNRDAAASEMGMYGNTMTLAEAASARSWKEKFPGVFTDGAVAKTQNGYRSANIHVDIEKVQRGGVTYYVADIHIASVANFRTAFAKGRFGSGIHDATDVIAQENGAVIAINGDYCGNNAGPVVRNGVLYRDEVYKDVLVLYADGRMETFEAHELDMNALADGNVWQMWTFGPMLLKDGQPMETFNSTLNPKNPRTAIGYYEPGHYCFVVADGRQPGYSEGFTLRELSQLFFEMGCKVAFNLDGGQSSAMSFLGESVNRPYKGGRGTSDIVYIAES